MLLPFYLSPCTGAVTRSISVTRASLATTRFDQLFYWFERVIYAARRSTFYTLGAMRAAVRMSAVVTPNA